MKNQNCSKFNFHVSPASSPWSALKTIPKPCPSTLAANSIESLVVSSYLIVISSSVPKVNA